MKRASVLIVALSVFVVGTSIAAVRLPGMFSDAMVLQRDIKLPVWGWAEPGEEVTVAIAGQKVTGTADKDGRWRVTLAPLKADGKGLEMTVSGKTNTIIFKDVLVGEVWLCGGQSNMAMGVAGSLNATQEIAAAHFPQIRLYQATRYPSPVARTEHRGNWAVCSSQNVGGWTAAGFFFARHLHKELGVPVGLINTSMGSMPIQTFASIQSLKVIPSARAKLEEYEKLVQVCLAQSGADSLPVKSGDQLEALYRETTNKIDAKLGSCGDQPEALYNSSIFPLAPYALRGAIWYQGESYSPDPDYYAQALPALITDWRKVWGQGDFPFGVVQLPNFGKRQQNAIGDGWPEFREAQYKGAQAVKNAGLVTTIDIGEPDIHPRSKQDVGKRLALWALANVYDQKNLPWRGPMFKAMQIEEDRIRIAFDDMGGGLQVKGAEPMGFAIAGKDKIFHLTQARLDGDSVVVWSDKVKEPVAVRYAWAGNPVGNLFNQAGLPAMPFRTDTWAANEVHAADGEKIAPAPDTK